MIEQTFLNHSCVCEDIQVYMYDITQIRFGYPRSSSRQRSKTPDSNEKMKRNVHFQDEKAITKSGPGDGTGRPDQREIMHSDGKVMLIIHKLRAGSHK